LKKTLIIQVLELVRAAALSPSGVVNNVNQNPTTSKTDTPVMMAICVNLDRVLNQLNHFSA
jgi:3-deoxy-D-manno-octulosonic acid (KDO) 8-phosphate synthase